MAKLLLEKAGISCEIIDAQENVELTKEYGVIKAPTLFIGGLKLENVSDIKKFIEENK